MEKLTREQVEKAIRREGPPHPLVRVLEHHQELIRPPCYVGLNYEEENQFAVEKWSSLVQSFSDAKDYSLGPYDLINVWSKVMEIIPDHYYLRCRWAGTISIFYASRGLKPLLDNLPFHYIETDELPPSILHDAEALTHLSSRVDDVLNSAISIRQYIAREGETPLLQQTCENNTGRNFSLQNWIGIAKRGLTRSAL